MLEDYYKKRDARARAKLVAQRDREWENWFKRYRDAQERGLSFDKPPPSSRDQNGTNSDK